MIPVKVSHEINPRPIAPAVIDSKLTRLTIHLYYDVDVPVDRSTPVEDFPIEKMFWVTPTDPNEDFGDFRGFVQGSWDEAVSVAGELAGNDFDGPVSVDVVEFLAIRKLTFTVRDGPDEDTNEPDGWLIQ